MSETTHFCSSRWCRYHWIEGWEGEIRKVCPQCGAMPTDVDNDVGILEEDPSRKDAEEAVRTLLAIVGESRKREGIVDTPRRVVDALLEMTRGMRQDAPALTTFSAEGMDQMVVMTAIPFASLCEHHMLPFVGTAVVGYLPDKQIVGLSKLPRVLDHFAARLQNQERLASQVADYLFETLQPHGVGVVLTARHFCMELRGVRKPGALTTTSALRGTFLDDANQKGEFFSLAQ